MLRCWYSHNHNVEVHAYPDNRRYCAVNNTDERQETVIYRADGTSFALALEPAQIVWYDMEEA